ncbi:MAG: tetratricopeptide repeat protein, partial [Candidatus Marinimicrobia bacterium]|nr:tetratricopeptide repeat protein [Candidatus Neomarinimicrobiota bacterium]
YYNLGIAYNNQGNYTKAIESYKKAIELKPDYALAYNNLGIAYNNQGNYTKAIESYKKAIELKPDYALAYNNRAIIYYSKEEYDKAWNDVNMAQSLGGQVHPGFLEALREASGRH